MAIIRALTGGNRALTGGKSVPLPEIPISEKELGTPVQDPRAKTTDDVGGVFARLFQRRENRQPTPKRAVQALKPVKIPMTTKTCTTDILTIGNAIREIYNSGEGKLTEEFTTGKDVKQWFGEIKLKISSLAFQRYIEIALSRFPPEDRGRLMDALIGRKSCGTDLLTIGNAIRGVYFIEEGELTEEFTTDDDVKKWLVEIKSNKAFDRYLLTAWKGFPPENRDQLMTAYFQTLRTE